MLQRLPDADELRAIAADVAEVAELTLANVGVHDRLAGTAVLAPDGSRLFAVSDRNAGLRLDISPQTWKRHACLVASRDLTPREWQNALPGQPYRTICRPA